VSIVFRELLNEKLVFAIAREKEKEQREKRERLL